MRRAIASLFIFIGVLLIMSAFGLFTYNGWDARRAQRASERVLDQLQYEMDKSSPSGGTQIIPGTSDQFRLDRLEDRDMTVLTIDGRDYIGYLSIPSIGLALPVMADWSYSDLKIAPCRYSGSLFRSDLVICAHNYARHFSPIKNLNVGARVEFVDMDRRLWVFEASEIQILQPTEVEKLVTTPDEDGEPEWDLTLFTCTTGGRTRFTLRCRRVEE